MYIWHKRIALVSSVALLAWLVSGIVMIIPQEWLQGKTASDSTTSKRSTSNSSGSGPSPPIFQSIQITIPEAIRVLAHMLQHDIQVTGIKVTRFEQTLVYQLTVGDGSVHLVDALSGQPITITQAKAEAMARRAAPQAGDIRESVLLTKSDGYYFGTPPVYRISFQDKAHTALYVSASTGDIQRIDWKGRVRRWIAGLHDFGPLHLLSEDRSLRVWLMLLFSVTSIIAIGTGLYLALPRWRKTPLMKHTTLVE